MIVRRVCCGLAFELGRSVPGEIRLIGFLLSNSLSRLQQTNPYRGQSLLIGTIISDFICA